jgi:hypothetical protein
LIKKVDYFIYYNTIHSKQILVSMAYKYYLYQQNNSNNSSVSKSSQIIIGIVFASLFGLVLLICIIRCFCYINHTHRQNTLNIPETNVAPANDNHMIDIIHTNGC